MPQDSKDNHLGKELDLKLDAGGGEVLWKFWYPLLTSACVFCCDREVGEYRVRLQCTRGKQRKKRMSKVRENKQVS